MRILVLLCILVALPAAARAAEWYVNDTSQVGDVYTSTTGDDTYAGNAAGAPKRTLAALSGLLGDGDTVWVDAGTYSESVVIDTDGVSLIGAGPALTIIDGGDSSPAGPTVIAADSRVGILIRDLRVTNGLEGIVLSACTAARIVNTKVDGHGYTGVQLSACALAQFESNTVSDNGGEGLRLDQGCADVVVRGNFLAGHADSSGLRVDGEYGRCRNIAVLDNFATGNLNGFYLNDAESCVLDGDTAQGNLDVGFLAVFADTIAWAHDSSGANGGRGYYLYAVNGGVLESCRGDGNGGAGLAIMAGSRDNAVIGGGFARNQPTGIMAFDVARLRLESVAVERNTAVGVEFDSCAWSSLAGCTATGHPDRGVHLKDCLSCTLTGVATGGNLFGVCGETVAATTLDLGRSTGDTFAIQLRFSGEDTVSNWLVQGCGNEGLTFETCGQVTVTGNTLAGIANSAIALTACTSSRIANNAVDGTAAEGIDLVGAWSVMVTGNSIRNAAYGINAAGGGDIRLENNLLDSNVWGMTFGAAAHSCTVTQNRFSANTMAAIGVGETTAPCFDLTIRKNDILTPGGSPLAGLVSQTPNALDCRRNWWGTADSATVRAMISDLGADSVVFAPYRLGPVDTAPGADTIAPAAPDTVGVATAGLGSLTVSWSPTVAEEEGGGACGDLAGYRVYRAAADTTTGWTLRGSTGAGVMQFTDSGMGAGETWYYRVTAYDNHAPYDNESFYSDSIALAVTLTGETVDRQAPPGVTGIYDTVVENILGTTNTFRFGQNSVDTLVLRVGDLLGRETFTLTLPFHDTGNVVRVGAVPSALLAFSDTSRIHAYAHGLVGALEVTVFDSTWIERPNSYWSAGDSPIIEFELLHTGINPNRAAFFWFNPADSAWYDVQDTVLGMSRGAYARTASTVSIPIDHFSHFFPGEGWVDTVSVALNGSPPSRFVLQGEDTITVVALHILADTVGTPADTLTLFTIRNMGTMVPADVEEVHLWLDNGDSRYSPGDTHLALLAAMGGPPYRWFAALSHPMPATGIDVVVTVNLAAAVGAGATFQAQIDSHTIQSEEEDSGPLADVMCTSVLTVIDLSQPNRWYVNDTSLVNDTWCTAPGDDANNGLNPSTPKRNLTAIVPLMAAGDTLLIDAGEYYSNLQVPADTTWFFGAGPAFSIVKPVAAMTGITISNRRSVTVRGLKTQPVTAGAVPGLNAMSDTGLVLEAVHTVNWNGMGFNLGGCVDARLYDCVVDSVAGDALALVGSSFNCTVDSCLIRNGQLKGLYSVSDSHTLTNNRVETTAQTGIYLDGADTCLVTGNRVSYVTGGWYGLYILGNGHTVRNNTLDSAGNDLIALNAGSTGNLIDSNTLRRAGNCGIRTYADSNTFTNNIIESSAYQGIVLSGADSNLFAGNRIGAARNMVSGVDIDGTGNTFFDNIVESAALHGFALTGSTSTHNLFDSNLVTGSDSCGFYVTLGPNTFSGNTVDTTRKYGFLIATSGCTVSGNRISNCWSGGDGIRLLGGDNRVSGNTVDSIAQDGIMLHVVNNCTVSANTVRRAQRGIEVSGANICLVESNAVTGCYSAAINLDGGSSFNLFRANTCTGQAETGDGLILTSASNNTFWSNTFGENYRGVFMNGANGNLFLQNVFDSNSLQAIFLMGSCADDTFSKNWIRGSAAGPDSCVMNNATGFFDFTRNWWDSTDSSAIRAKIWGTGRDSVAYIPYRLGGTDTAFGADTIAPHAPDTVAAAGLTTTSILVSWAPTTIHEENNTACGDLAGYRIYRASADTVSDWTLRGSAGAGLTQYTDSGVNSSETWYYRVTAYDDHAPYANESFYSDSIAGANALAYAGPIWYVSSDTGSDTSGDGSELLPYRTISQALISCTTGETVVIYNGTYIDAVTIAQDTITLLGASRDSTVISASGGMAFYVTDASGVIFRNLKIINASYGLYLSHAPSTICDSVWILAPTSNAICLEQIAGEGCERSVFTHNRIESSGGAAAFQVYVAGTSHDSLSWTGNEFLYGTSHAIYCEGDSYYVANNLFDSMQGSGFCYGSGHTIVDNVFRNNRGGAPALLLVDSSYVRGNLFDSNSGPGILVTGAANTVDSNVVTASDSCGIYATGSSNVFTNNRTESNAAHGIRCDGPYCALDSNTVRYNKASGIYNSGFGNRIAGGLVAANAGHGVQTWSSGLTVEQVEFDSNAQYAVCLDVSGCTVVKCDFDTGAANPDSCLFVSDVGVFNCTRNWWGSTDSTAILGKITGTGKNDVVYTPFRLGPVDTALGADTIAPHAPDSVSATPLSSAAILLAWNTPTINEEDSSALTDLGGYGVYRAAADTASSWALRGDVPAGTNQFTDTGLSPSETWYYRVTAWDNRLPYENESFLSDSIVFAMTDSVWTGPIWYVNDTSQAGDVWCANVGADTGDGSPTYPFLRIDSAVRHLAGNDSVYIDAGSYWTRDTILIETGAVTIMGKDSTATILDGSDSAAASGVTALVAAAVSGIRIASLKLTNYRNGLLLLAVDSSTLFGVMASYCGQHGFRLDSADSNLLSGCAALANGANGILLENGSDTNRITGCAATNSTADNIGLLVSHGNTVESSVAANSASWDGLYLDGANDNVIRACTLSGNRFGVFLDDNLGNASRDVIQGNTIEANSWDGVHLEVTYDIALRNNLIRDNGANGVNLMTAVNTLLDQNRIDSNAEYQVTITGGVWPDTLVKNLILPGMSQPDSGVYSDHTTVLINSLRNWWGTTDSTDLKSLIAGPGRDSVPYTPYRLGMVDTTPGADTIAPAAPDSVSAVALDTARITINWTASTVNEEIGTAVTDLAGYRVWRSQDPDTSLWLARGATAAGVTTFTDSNLTPSNTYYYRVTAFDNHAPYENQSFYSDSIAGATTLTDNRPDSPAGLSATAGDGSVSLAWFISSDTRAAGYFAYRATDTAGPFARISSETIALGSPWYTDTSVVNSTWYYFYVTAVDSSGLESDSSRIVAAFPYGETPAAPTGFQATPGNGQVVLRWNANSEPDLGGYYIYRSLVSGGPYDTHIVALKTATLAIDTAVTNDSTYFYIIKAFDTEVPSRISRNLAEVSATPSSVDTTAPVITHTAVTAAAVNTSIAITAVIIDDRAVAAGYLLFRPTGDTTWQTYALAATGDTYTSAIPDTAVTLAGVDYYLTALDNAGNIGYSANETNPHHVTVTAPDTTPPTITITRPDTGTQGWQAIILAQVTDSSGLRSVTLYYSDTTGTTYTDTAMSLVSGESGYRGYIPGDAVDTPMIYYKVRAIDNAGNMTETGPFVLEVTDADSAPPTITHTPRTTAVLGVAASITADIVDNVAVAEAILFFAGPDSATFDSAVMAHVSGTFYSGTIPAAVFSNADSAAYYYLRATDTAGNVAYAPSADSYAIDITATDTAGPVITHNPVTTAYVGETIALTAVVTDDSSGVKAVTLWWRKNGETNYCTAAMAGAGDAYSGSIPAESVTTVGVQYTISAVDTAGNPATWAGGKDTGSPYQVTVSATDQDSPVVTHDPVETGIAGLAIEIDATIADNIGVSFARLYFRKSTEVTFGYLAMTESGAGNYTATIPSDSVTTDSVDYYIRAWDAAGLYGSSGSDSDPYTIVVTPADSTPPVITHTPITRTFYRQDMPVSAVVTDTVGVTSVTFYYRTKGGTIYTAGTMTLDSNSTYTYTLASAYISLSGLEYYLKATDLVGNAAYAGDETTPYWVRVQSVPVDLSEARTYPNPWLPANGEPLTIHRLPADPTMTIEIYDRGMGLVDRLRVGNGIVTTANENIATWFGRTMAGRSIAPGVYSLLIRSTTGTRVIRMTIVK